jgi:proteasome lid subunit RPN8/RPN11
VIPLSWLKSLISAPRQAGRALPPAPKILLTEECVTALRVGLDPSRARRHEGVVYLLGRTDGTTVLAVSVFAPTARTTAGSFFVDTRSMALCAELAGRYELQIVAQVHTHPGTAFHSDGDVEGAKIRYPGFASVVLPDYGARLPSFEGAAVYLWRGDKRWQDLTANDIITIPGGGLWSSRNGTGSGTTGRIATPGGF